MSSEFAPTSLADIVWNQPPVPRPAAKAAETPGAFRQAVAQAAVQQQAAAVPAKPPREIVPHPFYEGEFVDARTGAIIQPDAAPPVQDDPTDGGRLVPHPFYEGEYYDPHAAEVAWFGEDGITVADVIDLINPLQHIPIVSSIYREVTGDTIDPGMRLIAGAALGGPIGFAVAMVNSIVEDGSGRDVGGHMLAMITGEEDSGATQFASLETAAGPAPALAAAEIAAASAAPVTPASHRPTLGSTHVPIHKAMAQMADAAAIPPTAPMLAAGPMALPETAGVPGKTPTPAEALIQARAAVPSAGPIPALGSSRATRIAGGDPAPTPEQAQQMAISARLDAHLARLAAMSGEKPQSAAPPAPAASAPATRPETAAPAAAPARVAPPARPEEPLPAGPAPVPTPLVPQAMSEALEKYRAMMRPASPRTANRGDST